MLEGGDQGVQQSMLACYQLVGLVACSVTGSIGDAWALDGVTQAGIEMGNCRCGTFHRIENKVKQAKHSHSSNACNPAVYVIGAHHVLGAHHF